MRKIFASNCEGTVFQKYSQPNDNVTVNIHSERAQNIDFQGMALTVSFESTECTNIRFFEDGISKIKFIQKESYLKKE